MKLEFKQYPIDENGYPVDLPDLGSFLYPPYMMPYLEQNGITVRYQEDDDLDTAHRWAIQYWILLNSHFAEFHNSPLGDENRIISMAVDECEILFRGFMATVLAWKNCSFRMSDLQAKLWVESTKRIVWAAFRNNRLSSDTMNKRRGTSRLLKDLFFTLDKLYDSFSESAPDSPYTSVEARILYNLWGDDYRQMYESTIKKDILTSSDKAKVNVEENKREFYDEVEERIRVATEESSELAFDAKAKALCRDLERLFVDYMRRIRITKITDGAVTDFICNHWKDVTIAILHRAYTILTAEYAVAVSKGRLSTLAPCEDGEEMYAHDKRAKIVEMASMTVDTICSEFVNKGKTHPWDAKLKALDVHFDDLYMAMKDEYFTGITRRAFEYAIREADFHEILIAAQRKGMRSGKIGAIYFFISELGDNLGNEWLYKAAESVTTLKGSDAVKKIRSHSKTDHQKAFKELLKKHITYYKPREQRQRSIQ